ncbi:putative quinol monooxygenase [Rosenbergiella australiborealis]|uniref:Antibiotic biosynthesis monooxygenase n=1 Tax=Rosenbergiella australiborealis TaxID=1544696 RepID=A0ABS5T700_9GAMM|nr:antibiotic biosynthesis monooxygenase [Rosenbergiella australiborealis]MBT0727217.1 antibiotic biosynthesis monooxygenase [Rosenbergiella australiborealis]
MVTLNGYLRCRTPEESQIVSQYLPAHRELSLQEAGCIRFSVVQTAEPQVWRVEESFIDYPAFEYHQQRVMASEWGEKTVGIVRDYVITEE